MKDFSPEVIWRDLDEITPYALNNKKHPQEQVDKIAASIVEFGVDQPIVVDGDGVIIKGHGRALAARKSRPFARFAKSCRFPSRASAYGLTARAESQRGNSALEDFKHDRK